MAKRRRSGLGRSAKLHSQHASAAHAHAKRFIVATERSLKNRADCDAILQNAMHARSSADQAVAEAAHGRTSGASGPTAMQSKTSDTADKALYLWHRVMHRCARKKPIK